MSQSPASPPANPSSPFASWTGDHVGLRVADFDAAVAWYADKLDFRLVRTWGGGPMTFGFLSPAADDSFRLELLAGPGAVPPPPYETLRDSLTAAGWHHLCLRVGDVDAAVAELRRRAVTILAGPFDVPERQARIAFFADPWGNILELSQAMEVHGLTSEDLSSRTSEAQIRDRRKL